MKKECAACGAIREMSDKPEPVTAKEGRQVLFNCRVCGAVNYRDGTAALHGQRSGKHGQIPGESVEEPIAEKSHQGLFWGIFSVVLGLLGAFMLLHKRQAAKKEKPSASSVVDPLSPPR